MKKFGLFWVTYSVIFTLLIFCNSKNVCAENSFKQRIKERLLSRSGQSAKMLNRTRPSENIGNELSKAKIAGREVSIWEDNSEMSGGKPLLIFSHGFKGCSTQSTTIMKAIAHSGFIVIAPNHLDASCNKEKKSTSNAPSFSKPDQWNDSTYKNRGDDIREILAELKVDPMWSKKINFSQVALSGHSLGGYTVLALAGGWKSWKLPDIKAVIAFSPYSLPLINQKSISDIDIPIMFQGGTRDLLITPHLKKSGGAFDQSKSPAYFIEFQEAGHFYWTDINKKNGDVISNYCISFLKRHVLEDRATNPSIKLNGVSLLKSK
jgi:predicted dienelactone hydrolase